jgi:signal transduction histidine kinase/DNA-binding response OmpR family regulator
VRTSPRGRRPLVWIVDDSPTEAAIAERSLGPAYEFEWFSEGGVVVERLAAGAPQPDLVLLDWVMPGMAGDDVCRFLRSHPRTLELPIILITASRIDTTDVAQGLACGANDYVARPFATEELRARVDSAIRAKQLADLARQERRRLSTINRLGRALFEAGSDIDRILNELATSLTVSICDGCSILMLPGPVAVAAVTRHAAEPSGESLAGIASLADPVVHRFESSEQARATLPPAYSAYIERFGLRGLAILPFPSREPLRGIVTVTREGGSAPFELEDLATIETCIEYASLAIESAARFDAERIGRAQLDAVLTNLPTGVIVTDANGKVSLVNTAAGKLIPGTERAGTLDDVFRLATWTTSGGTSIAQPEWQLLVTQSSRTEILIRLPREIAVAVAGVPLRDARGVSTGSVIVIHDVSAEYAANAERERTAQFQQQMLGIVGHDLRNPIGAILVATELLEMNQQARPADASVIKRIATISHRMSRMVDQLLDVTRARLGDGIPVLRREMELVPLIKSAIDELSLAYPKTQVELVATSEVVGIWDPDRLGQVVSNVMSNAVHYGQVGAPIVVEVTSSELAATITVHNAIRDQPISREALATLFDPYRRGHHGGTNANGLGLGLYIVHEIVRAHGGTMEVESVASGTTFRVMLPRTKRLAS